MKLKMHNLLPTLKTVIILINNNNNNNDDDNNKNKNNNNVINNKFSLIQTNTIYKDKYY